MVYLLPCTTRNQPFMWVNTVDGSEILHQPLVYYINLMKKWQTSPSQLVIAGFLPLVEAPGRGSTGAAGAAGGRRAEMEKKWSPRKFVVRATFPGRNCWRRRHLFGGTFFWGRVPSSKLTWQWKFTFFQ